MATEFKLPEVQDGVTDVDIGEIMVSEGDSVEEGQPLMEVETEKAAAPVEADFSGTIEKIMVSEGDSVEVGAVLLTYGSGDGGGSSSSDDSSAEESSGDEKDSGSEEKTETESKQDAESKSTGDDEGTSYPQSPDKSTSTLKQNELARPDLASEVPPPATPNVRRAARERGIDLHTIQGSGSGGRITMEDLDSAPKTQGGMTVGVRGGQGMVSAPQLPDFNKYGEISRERMQKLSRTAARNLSVAWQTIPHVTQHELVDITELEAARKRFVKGIGQGKPKVTMTALMAKACVTVLKEFPKFNASFDHDTDEVVYKHFYNIGIAVDTEFGLVVPVIFDADQKSILEIAADLTDIAGRARDRKLSGDDMQGGTFTITNLGGIGGSSFTPIVNHPEVAILGMSRSQKQLELDDDGDIVQKLMLPLSLSYDHRVINGADAARFIVRLNGLLADPMQLLVEM